VLEGGPNNEHIEATRGSYNVQRGKRGILNTSSEASALQLRGRHVLPSTSNAFFFTGRVSRKLALTISSLPTVRLPPASCLTQVDVLCPQGSGGSRRQCQHLLRRLSRDGNPALYFPFATHPVQKNPRQSGFLIPNIGSSSTRVTHSASRFLGNQPQHGSPGRLPNLLSKRGWAPKAGSSAPGPTENVLCGPDLLFQYSTARSTA